MTHTNLSYRCYILPIVAGIIYVLFSLPVVEKIFLDWIPNTTYRIMTQALLLVVILFLTCRILDMYWNSSGCHDSICDQIYKG